MAKKKKELGPIGKVAVGVMLALLLAATALGLQYGLELNGRADQLAKDGIDAVATITSLGIEEIKTGGGKGTGSVKKTYVVSYTFEDAGGVAQSGAEKVDEGFYETLSVGKEVKARYLPGDVVLSTLGHNTANGWIVIAASGAMMLFLLVAAGAGIRSLISRPAAVTTKSPTGSSRPAA